MSTSALSFSETLTGISTVIKSQTRFIRFLAGTRIFAKGDPGDFAYMIDDGYVEISSMTGTRKTILAILGPGEIFGEMALLDGQPRSATATALQ